MRLFFFLRPKYKLDLQNLVDCYFSSENSIFVIHPFFRQEKALPIENLKKVFINDSDSKYEFTISK